jgi:hypothetical protein
VYSRRDGVDPGRSRAGTSSASSGIWGRLSRVGWVVRVRVLRRALARGDLKRLQRFQEFVSVHVHLGTGVDNVVTDNVPSPWVRVKVYRPLDPSVPLTLAVALHEAAVSCCRRMRERALALAQHSKMDELDGGGSCTGGSMKIGPSLPIGSGQGASVVTSYTPPRPSQLPRMLCSPMGTASSLSRGRILKGSAPSPSASERQSG